MKNFLLILIFSSLLCFPIYGKDNKTVDKLLAVQVKKKNSFGHILKKIITAPKYSSYTLRLFFDKHGRVNW